jgi:hypothetical protein
MLDYCSLVAQYAEPDEHCPQAEQRQARDRLARQDHSSTSRLALIHLRYSGTFLWLAVSLDSIRPLAVRLSERRVAS